MDGKVELSGGALLRMLNGDHIFPGVTLRLLASRSCIREGSSVRALQLTDGLYTFDYATVRCGSQLDQQLEKNGFPDGSLVRVDHCTCVTRPGVANDVEETVLIVEQMSLLTSGNPDDNTGACPRSIEFVPISLNQAKKIMFFTLILQDIQQYSGGVVVLVRPKSGYFLRIIGYMDEVRLARERMQMWLDYQCGRTPVMPTNKHASPVGDVMSPTISASFSIPLKQIAQLGQDLQAESVRAAALIPGVCSIQETFSKYDRLYNVRGTNDTAVRKAVRMIDPIVTKLVFIPAGGLGRFTENQSAILRGVRAAYHVTASVLRPAAGFNSSNAVRVQGLPADVKDAVGRMLSIANGKLTEDQCGDENDGTVVLVADITASTRHDVHDLYETRYRSQSVFGGWSPVPQYPQIAAPDDFPTLEEARRDEDRLAEAARKRERAILEAARLEAARREAARLEKTRLEAIREENARQEVSRAEEAKRVEKARLDAARAEEARRVEKARLEAARAEEAKRVEKARLEAARAEESKRVEKARLEAIRLEEVRRLEAQRLEKARKEAERLEKVRLDEAARVEAERLEKFRQDGIRAEQARAEQKRFHEVALSRAKLPEVARLDSARLEATRHPAAQQKPSPYQVATHQELNQVPWMTSPQASVTRPSLSTRTFTFADPTTSTYLFNNEAVPNFTQERVQQPGMTTHASAASIFTLTIDVPHWLVLHLGQAIHAANLETARTLPGVSQLHLTAHTFDNYKYTLQGTNRTALLQAQDIILATALEEMILVPTQQHFQAFMANDGALLKEIQTAHNVVITPGAVKGGGSNVPHFFVEGTHGNVKKATARFAFQIGELDRQYARYSVDPNSPRVPLPSNANFSGTRRSQVVTATDSKPVDSVLSRGDGRAGNSNGKLP
ncbi:hypothetical protein BV898_12047 [Hypsibius exemplaris]|uniref:Uncharacterized protein n=1 Tax=Hypsibius exemplaris TaxID=2072580 RepID=A0A1W0WEW9_HYPEX|nr:hypothetical protein BV898_12047 [Hypsibius exemplaris]